MNVPATTQNHGLSMLMDPTAFEHMNRVGKVLAMSPLFPDHLRKGDRETAIANGILVMNMAIRLNEDPLTVAQNIYFVGGKPGWSASYMISKANQHGVFKNPISWDIKGEGDDLSVTAFADLAGTGQRVSATCDMAMAKAEGWTRNAKYKSMPELMLRYRSGTMLIRLYCPEVMIGIPSQAENDMPMRDVTPYDMTPPQHRTGAVAGGADETPHDEDGEVIDQDPEPVKEKPKAAAKPKPQEAAKPDSARPANDTPPEPAVDDDQDDSADKAQNERPADPDEDEAMMRLFQMVTTDLEGTDDVDEVLDMYGPQIDQMKDRAPSLHADLMEKIEAARG